MTDERFEDLMRDARKTYRTPPEPDFDAMWEGIERAHFGSATPRVTELRRRFPAGQWIGIAATLMIGIGIGRASLLVNRPAPVTPQVQAVAPAPAAPTRTDVAMSRPYELETSEYLGQTAALLVSLPAEARPGRTDPQVAMRAADLLGRTRLLMDSPAANDPNMRGLLDDLELVLMQVARLEGGGSRTDLDLIHRALEQRDVIPRLRTAVADISAN